MSALQRKLGRDLLNTTGVLLTVVAIIAVGAGSLIALLSAQRILEHSQHTYYRDYRFADFWIDVKKAPLTAVQRIARLDGVADVQARVVFDVILDLPDVVQPLTGRLLSTPARGFESTINGIHLVRGSGFSDDRDEEVILSEAFAAKHDLDPGDRISLILNRKRQSFVIVGTAISPEYIYMVRGEGDFAPDPEHFGILYVKESYARDVLDFQDACNEIVGELSADYDGDIEILLDRMERILDPYGVFSTTPREHQASNRFLSDEIRGLGVTAMVMPVIFLGVAALVLNILMNRLAERQRTIIGTLKALGYSDRRIMRHFLSFGAVVGLVGGLAGIGAGVGMAAGMIELYKTFFQFPRFVYQLYPDLLVIAVAISLAFAISGTAKGVWKVLKLEPAEAMRSKPPERGGAIFLEHFPALWRRLGFRTHVALRSLARNRGRTATGITASALSSAIVLMTLIMYDSTYFLIDFQFDYVARSDVDVGMRDERSVAALLEADRLPGVDYAEPLLGVACHLRNGYRSRRVTVTGLSANHRLTVPMQRDLTPIDVPPEGVVLSNKLAEILDAHSGDHLELTPIRGRRETHEVFVAATVESFIGLDCYADIRYLSSVVGEALAVNSVQLAIDPQRENALFRSLKNLPNAQGVSVGADARRNIENTLTETMATSLGVTILFAGVIAFGSMLNASLIEIGDRLREISTFRVLGYTPGQIAGIFFRQNLVVFLAGFALAMPLGYGISRLTAQAYDTELFRMPIIMDPRVVLLTGGLTFSFVLIAQVFVYQRVRTMDWQEGIKVKE